MNFYYCYCYAAKVIYINTIVIFIAHIFCKRNHHCTRNNYKKSQKLALHLKLGTHGAKNTIVNPK